MRIKAAAVNAGGLMAGGFVGAKLGGKLAESGAVPPAMSGAVSNLGVGLLAAMFFKRGVAAELAHGALVGGIVSAAAVGLSMVKGGGA